MFWLIFGIIIWADVHLFKRVMPAGRRALDEALGEKAARGVIALALVISVVMIVIGFREMGWETVYTTPAWLRGIGTIFAFLGIVLLGAGHSKSRIRGILRHPMLTGVILWGIGHYMITGLLSGLILFTGMIIWAVAEIRLINKQEPEYTPYKAGTLRGDLILLAISVVVTVIVLFIHYWLIVGFHP